MENSLLMFTLAFALTSLCCASTEKAVQTTTAAKLGHGQGLGAAWSEPAEDGPPVVVRKHAPRSGAEVRADLWMEPDYDTGNAEGLPGRETPRLNRVLAQLMPNDADFAPSPSQRRMEKAERLSYPEPATTEDQERRYARLERRVSRSAKQ